METLLIHRMCDNCRKTETTPLKYVNASFLKWIRVTRADLTVNFCSRKCERAFFEKLLGIQFGIDKVPHSKLKLVKTNGEKDEIKKTSK